MSRPQTSHWKRVSARAWNETIETLSLHRKAVIASVLAWVGTNAAALWWSARDWSTVTEAAHGAVNTVAGLIAAGVVLYVYHWFSAAAAMVAEAETARDDAATRIAGILNDRALRLELKELVGAGHLLGQRLYGIVTKPDPRLDRWANQVADLVSAAFGESEAGLLFDSYGMTFYVDVGGHGQRDQARNYISARQIRLRELLQRIDTLPVRPDFIIEDWRNYLDEVRTQWELT